MGVCINEYRAGQLISKTYRDYSLTLVTCYEINPVTYIDKQIEVKIYPNPATDKVTVELESSEMASLRILSPFGQEVLNQTFASQTQVDLSTLPIGLYLVEIVIGDKMISKKIIKE